MIKDRADMRPLILHVPFRASEFNVAPALPRRRIAKLIEFPETRVVPWYPETVAGGANGPCG